MNGLNCSNFILSADLYNLYVSGFYYIHAMRPRVALTHAQLGEWVAVFPAFFHNYLKTNGDGTPFLARIIMRLSCTCKNFRPWSIRSDHQVVTY